LRVIQEVSGHNGLGTLQRYLGDPEQRRKAVAVMKSVEDVNPTNYQCWFVVEVYSMSVVLGLE